MPCPFARALALGGQTGFAGKAFLWALGAIPTTDPNICLSS